MFQMSSFHCYISRILSFVAGSCIKFGLNCSFYLLLSLLEIVQQQQNNQATFVAIIHILCGKILKSNMNHSTLIHQESIFPSNLEACGSQLFSFQRVGSQSLGQTILQARRLFTENYWYWIGIGALFGYTIFFNLLFTFFLSTLNRKFFFSKKKNPHHQFLEKAMLIDGTTMKK